MPDLEKLSAIVVDAGFKLHDALGPGLLESAYELILCERLRQMGLKVDRQMPINIAYDGIASSRLGVMQGIGRAS